MLIIIVIGSPYIKLIEDRYLYSFPWLNRKCKPCSGPFPKCTFLLLSCCSWMIYIPIIQSICLGELHAWRSVKEPTERYSEEPGARGARLEVCVAWWPKHPPTLYVSTRVEPFEPITSNSRWKDQHFLGILKCSVKARPRLDHLADTDSRRGTIHCLWWNY